MDTKDEALKMAIEALEYFEIDYGACDLLLPSNFYKILNACKEALEQPAQAPVAWIKALEIAYIQSYKEDERVTSRGWRTNLGLKPEPDDVPLYTHPAPIIELKPANIAKARDEIYYAWRKYWAWGIPSKDGEAVFNANGDGFLAGWLACEEWINKDKNI